MKVECMIRDYYTTSQAAEVLSVSADTVLRWVKSGKIESYLTPGGHARIPHQAVRTILQRSDAQARPREAAADTAPSHLFCWDMQSEQGRITESCRQCATYRSRSGRCYRIRCDCEDFAGLHLRCQDPCDDCSYYRVTRRRPVRAMLVSPSGHLRRGLSTQATETDLDFCAVDGAYACSTEMQEFRPDYLVVDCAFGTSRTREICRHLLDDRRLPITRIILASPRAKLRENCDREVFGWIRKPFNVGQLRSLIDSAAARADGDFD